MVSWWRTGTYFNHEKIKISDTELMNVNLTLSANHPVHPCAPAKASAHAYTKNCSRIHRKFPEDAHARAQQRTQLYCYFLTSLNNDSEPQ